MREIALVAVLAKVLDASAVSVVVSLDVSV